MAHLARRLLLGPLFIASLFYLGFRGVLRLSGATEAAVRELRACPRILEWLGPDLDVAWEGLSYGNLKSSPTSGWVKWTLPVAGSRAEGVFHFSGTKSASGWTVSGTLEVEGSQVHTSECHAASLGSVPIESTPPEPPPAPPTATVPTASPEEEAPPEQVALHHVLKSSDTTVRAVSALHLRDREALAKLLQDSVDNVAEGEAFVLVELERPRRNSRLEGSAWDLAKLETRTGEALPPVRARTLTSPRARHQTLRLIFAVSPDALPVRVVYQDGSAEALPFR